MHSEKSKSPLITILLAIGLKTVGQVPAGIYLPSMVAMGIFFKVGHGYIQTILGIYLLSYGASQLVYGPISDLYGRKLTSVVGLIIFFMGCFASIFSKSIYEMFFGSFLQGIGLGSVAVVSTAVLRDLFHDKRLLASSSYMGAATIVTPLIAPIIGSYLQVGFGWRAPIAFSLFYGFFVFILIILVFYETNVHAKIQALSIRKIVGGYISVLKSVNFVKYAACRVLALSGGTAYAATAPFIFITLFRYSPVKYAWISIIPAIGFFIGSLLVKRLGKNRDEETIVRIGALLLCLGSFLFLIIWLIFGASPEVVVICMLIYMLGSGIIFPSALSGAILPLGVLAGTASGFIGSFQNLGRGAFSSLVGYFHNYTIYPLVITLCILSLSCILIAFRLNKIMSSQKTP